jgi:hypothetical protein
MSATTNPAKNRHPRTRRSADSARLWRLSRVVRAGSRRRAQPTGASSTCTTTVSRDEADHFGVRRAKLQGSDKASWQQIIGRRVHAPTLMPSELHIEADSERSVPSRRPRALSRGVVVTTASVKQPAACAASSPFGRPRHQTTTRVHAQAPRGLQDGSGCGLPFITSSSGHDHCGASSCARRDSGLSEGTVHDVAIAFLASIERGSASVAPGSTTHVDCTSASSSSAMRLYGSSNDLRHHMSRDHGRDGMP